MTAWTALVTVEVLNRTASANLERLLRDLKRLLRDVELLLCVDWSCFLAVTTSLIPYSTPFFLALVELLT